MKRIKLDMRTILRSKVTLLFMTLGLLIAVPAVALAQDALDPTGAPSPAPPAPTIQSDKEDYPPADTVILTGSGWQPGETVNINVNDDEGQTWNRNVDVIADENGGVRDEFVLPDWFVATYSVTATGSSGGTATSTFTDAVLPARGCPAGRPIVVDTTEDQFDANSATNECSLREAINAANADITPDTITLPAGSYTLTRTGSGEDGNSTGDLDVLQALTINGAGATTTNIQAGTDNTNGIDRVLHVLSSGSLTLNGATVRYGQIDDDGGGIKTDRPLTLTDVAITENDATTGKSGGGISHQGNNILTLNRVTISGNKASLDGGGLRSTSGGARLTDVAITDNQAGNGGGISYQGNELTFNGGTISGNKASLDGGGLHSTSGIDRLTDVAITDNQAGNGGGISHQSSQLVFNGVTISGNKASLDGGGLYSFATTSGSGSLTNVTITNNSATGNGGGLRAAGVNPDLALPNLNLSQATVSHNSAPNGSNISRSTGPVSLRNTIVSDGSGGANCAGAVQNFANNLDSGTSCGFGTASNSKSSADAKLGDLADNGGPTKTRTLLSGSAAIDAGNGFLGTSFDQRHEPRPKDGDGNGTAVHDIGAYELQAPLNAAPVANDDAATTNEDTSVAIDVKANDTDASGNSLSVVASSLSDPANGEVALITSGADAGKVRYTPDPNYNNTGGTNADTFTYKVSDGTAESNAATVRVTVNPVDDDPVAANDQATVLEDADAKAIDVLANDTDADGGPKTIASVTQPANGTVSITGGGSGLTYEPNANSCNNGSPTDDFTYTLNGGSTATVVVTMTCVNDSPTTPGAITSSESLNNDGTFTLDWGASTDVEGDDVTYTLEKRDSDDANFSEVDSSLTSTSYTFGGTNAVEGEGTWDYRVKAVDSPAGAESDYSTAEKLVKVDKSGPNDPTLSFSTSANQSLKATVSGVDWYKDSALIDVAANGDPALADASDGSGIDAASLLPNPFSVTQNGTSTASRTVKDNANNESAAGELPVKVDAANPALGNCPTAEPFILNSGGGTQSVTITASDGESGLDNAASTLSGSVNTSTVGEKTVTFKAVDHVGHEVTKECKYNVNYAFSGFMEPINNTAPQIGTDVSTFKAGSTVPVKFQLKDANGNVVQSASAPQWLTPQKGSLTSQAVNESLYIDPATTGTTFKWDGSQYHYNWGTAKDQTGSYWRIAVKLDDGQTYYVNISLR